MNDNDLGRLLFGSDPDRLSVNTRSSPARGMSQITATAVSDSSGGFVELSVSGEVLEVPTTFAVKRGDEVIVSLAKNVPTVVGVVGKGDKVDNLVASTIKATTAIVSQVIAGSVTADTITAVEAYIESLKAGDFAADSIEATTAEVVNLIAKDAKFDSLSATKAVIGTLEAAKAYIEELTAKEITAEKLEAATAYIGSLTAEDVTAEQIAAGLAAIGTLDTTYANIDFANVDVANIGEFFAKSGIIQDIVTESGTVTGRLVGVTIVGDLIEAGTLKADKLVVKGEDGLYYKLNVNGETVESEQTDYNSINGSSIQAQSITATKISVSDLVAFGATIGGLVIEDGSLHSLAKDAHDSGVNGFFMGADGSAGFGGAASYLRYDAETDELEIKASSVVIDTSAVAKAEDAIKGVELQYALSSSATVAPTSGWSAVAPPWQAGKHMWQRKVETKADGTSRVGEPTCISGAQGQPGKDGQDGSPGAAGAPGKDGKTYYTWLKYADSPTSGMSDDPAGKEYIGLAYNKTTATESANYSDYTWSLVKGDKGDQGLPGGKGADGKTYYTWVKYATSSTGAGMSDSPAGKTYIGLAYNKSTATESTVATDYAWSLIKGDKGDKGDEGIPGPKGADGASTYFHVAYANSADGTVGFSVSDSANKTYIGTYVDSVAADSASPSKYSWQLVKGAQGQAGEQGIPGKNGANGQTSYLHIAYATNSTGTAGFSVSDSAGKTYIGQYTDFVQADSTTPSKYSWTLIKGPAGAKGETGQPGSPGAAGAPGKGIKSTTVEYQAGTSGTTAPTGAWQTAIPSVAANQYLWTRITVAYTEGASSTAYSIGKMGANGSPGTPGAAGNGVKSTAVAYQASASATTSPTGTWASSPPSVAAGQYLWTRITITYTNNATTTAYSVARQGANGSDGKDGADGKTLYGTCATAANVAAKVAAAAGYKLYQGATVAVKFAASNTVTTAITLNVQSTGAKNVYVNGALTSSANRYTWDAGDTVQFVYDGTGYVPLSDGAYVKETASGVEVGKPGAPVKSLVNASGSFDVLDSSGSVLSRFAAKLIELGKSATDAVIRLCGGTGEIKAEAVEGVPSLTMSSASVAMRGGTADGQQKAYFRAGLAGGLPQAVMAAYYEGTTRVASLSVSPDGAYVNGLPVYGAKIVYSNVSAGTSGTVTTNETSANFVYFEIFFRTNDGERSSTRVYQPNGKIANLTSARITSTDGRGWVKSKQVQISGKSIAYVGYAGESSMGMADGGGTNYVGGTLIYLVVGYK